MQNHLRDRISEKSKTFDYEHNYNQLAKKLSCLDLFQSPQTPLSVNLKPNANYHTLQKMEDVYIYLSLADMKSIIGYLDEVNFKAIKRKLLSRENNHNPFQDAVAIYVL